MAPVAPVAPERRIIDWSCAWQQGRIGPHAIAALTERVRLASCLRRLHQPNRFYGPSGSSIPTRPSSPLARPSGGTNRSRPFCATSWTSTVWGAPWSWVSTTPTTSPRRAFVRRVIPVMNYFPTMMDQPGIFGLLLVRSRSFLARSAPQRGMSSCATACRSIALPLLLPRGPQRLSMR